MPHEGKLRTCAHVRATSAIGAAQSRKGLQPAQSREIEIEYDHRRMVRFAQADRFLAICGFADFAPRFSLQQSPQPGADDGMIIDDQDLHRSVSLTADGVG